jgi:hypothetical protein
MDDRTKQLRYKQIRRILEWNSPLMPSAVKSPRQLVRDYWDYGVIEGIILRRERGQ